MEKEKIEKNKFPNWSFRLNDDDGSCFLFVGTSRKPIFKVRANSIGYYKQSEDELTAEQNHSEASDEHSEDELTAEQKHTYDDYLPSEYFLSDEEPSEPLQQSEGEQVREYMEKEKIEKNKFPNWSFRLNDDDGSCFLFVGTSRKPIFKVRANSISSQRTSWQRSRSRTIQKLPMSIQRMSR